MITPHLRPLRLAVLALLDKAMSFNHGDWSVQGFGVLRYYIRDVGRIHLWDDRLRYPGVSMIHNHTWHLRSTVVCGTLKNQRYLANDWKFFSWAEPYKHMRLITGYQSKPTTEPNDVWMVKQSAERYLPGDVYLQTAHEIHETIPANGTITVMERNESQQGEADVYWPADGQWGTATPRPATPEEVSMVVETAIAELTRPIRGLTEYPV